MIIVNINSGLGNQLYGYALYLALKKLNPEQQCFIDNSSYWIAGKENKYQIEDIFHLKIDNIRNMVSKEDYMEYIESSRVFSERLPDNWLSKIAILSRFNLYNMIKKYGYQDWSAYTDLVSPYRSNVKTSVLLFFKRVPIIADTFYKIKPQQKKYNMREFYSSIFYMNNIKKECLFDDSYFDKIFKHERGNHLYIGNFEMGDLLFKSAENEVREAYVFPPINDHNIDISRKIQSTNAVSIHVRRGDHIQSNDRFFKKDGYYYRSVQLVKDKISQPFFFFFSDDIEWCKKNRDIFGLSEEDKTIYVEGNTGVMSFRDMQLMSLCKHNIVPVSTFSWWASYLNTYDEKIVIAPRNYYGNASFHI